ncbi:MAG: insulinase family protein, partial [Novosphingobium sp.]
AEVAEQVANVRTAAQNAAAAADTRSHGALANAAFALIRDDQVPATPETVLERLEAFIPQITPDAVLKALKREALPLKAPLLRLQGRRQPEGGEAAVRAAWAEAMRAPLVQAETEAQSTFAYTDFGAPGVVLSDSRETTLEIRQVRFANGVRLNVRRTANEKDRVLVRLSIDGGNFLDTHQTPLATEMTSFLAAGGLGRHSRDDLQSLLAGRTVSMELASGPETFVSSAQTTPRDLELQLQLLAALVTDPGYRPEGEVHYRLNINNFFAQSRATPVAALTNSIGGIISDNDPRFTLQAPDDYRKLTFAQLKEAIGERLAHGAIEIGIVGDIDEDQAIALVGRTFGALPRREPDFRAWDEQRIRAFTADRTRRVIRHTGPADQALLRYTWATRDDRDPDEVAALTLLERVIRIELTETLREKLGKAYSPAAASAPSHTWRGYGTFGLAASVAVGEVAATRMAIAETLDSVRDAPIGDDELQRARQPLLEAHDNALKTNSGWLALVDRAQTQPDMISRHLSWRERLLAVTPARLQALAQRYLGAKDAVEVLVLPEGVDEPQPAG